jgi:phosphonate transport system substrate-binding protein
MGNLRESSTRHRPGKSMFPELRYFRLPLFWVASLVLLALIPGCSGEGDTRIVDFTKTIPAARSEDSPAGGPVLRVAVGAMVSPKETFVQHRRVLEYIGQRLGRGVELVQRKTYGELNELFAKGQIDLAFVCSGPYATGKERYGFELLATPEIQGSHFYQAYLIVNKGSTYRSLEDLKGRVFAFTDPDSNTGRLVPTYWLARLHATPEAFFGKVIYTYAHDNSILAVARGLVDGATVDGLVWEYYNRKNPRSTSQTRVIRKSESYGNPPLVASKYLAAELRNRIRQSLLAMHTDPEGKLILKELMIDRFVAPEERWYDSIRRMEKSVALRYGEVHAPAKPQE